MSNKEWKKKMQKIRRRKSKSMKIARRISSLALQKTNYLQSSMYTTEKVLRDFLNRQSFVYARIAEYAEAYLVDLQEGKISLLYKDEHRNIFIELLENELKFLRAQMLALKDADLSQLANEPVHTLNLRF